MSDQNLLATLSVTTIAIVLPVLVIKLNMWHRQQRRSNSGDVDKQEYNEW